MSIRRQLKLLTGDPRTNRPIWIEHEEASLESPDPVEAWLVIWDMAKLPMKLAREYALMGAWPDGVSLDEVEVMLSGLPEAVPVATVDAEGAVPAPAQEEKPIEVSGSQVQVYSGVEQVEAPVASGSAAAETNLSESEVSMTAVGIDAAGGLASDDAGEQHGVEQVVPGLEADKVGDVEPTPAAETR